jgi:hypothetical protein
VPLLFLENETMKGSLPALLLLLLLLGAGSRVVVRLVFGEKSS